MIKSKQCQFEPQTVESLRFGVLPEQLNIHAQNCADCREAIKVAGFLLRAAVSSPPEKLPAAGFLWWKSKIIEKRRRAAIVSRPILIAQAAAAFFIFGTFGWLLVNRQSFGSAAGRVLNSIESIAAPLFAGVICFSFVCAALIFIMHRYLTEK